MKTKKKNVVKSGPVFTYTSVCCSVPAKKEPTGKKDKSWVGLGAWHCTGCTKRCKVTRSKTKEEQA